MRKKELELELELRHTRKGLMMANIRIIELQLMNNDMEINRFSEMLNVSCDEKENEAER